MQVQRSKLNRVGFVRIGLPAGRSLPPLSGWPLDLAEVVRGQTFFVKGGVEYDGRAFEHLDELAVVEAAKQFADNGTNAIVVSGSFSPIDPQQENRAAELIAEQHPGARSRCHTSLAIRFAKTRKCRWPECLSSGAAASVISAFVRY